MATVVFQAVGTYIGGPVGGMIGAAIGGVIDQALFGPGDQEGPRLDDLSVMASTYGAPLPLLYGPENRVAGNIIWSSGLIETKTKSGGKGGGPSYTEYSYRASVALAFSGREVKGLKRIWANNKVIYDVEATPYELPPITLFGQEVTKYFTDTSSSPTETVLRGTHAVMDEIHFYPGNNTQLPDSLIESYEGVGNVPAYRNTAYIVIKDLQLADFGNRIPNLEVEIEADTSISVAEAVLDMTNRANISPVAVFGLADTVRGYTVARQSPVYKAIAPLEVAFNFEVTEQRGQIRCVKKGRGMKGTILIEHMGAHPSGGTKPSSPYNLRNISEVVMPNQVSIIHKDPDMDHQKNTQTAFRRQGNAVNKIAQELPVTLAASEARKVADRLLWGSWSNKKAVEFDVGPIWSRLNASDIIGVSVFDEVLPFKVGRTTRGNNGITETALLYEDPEIYNSNASGIAGTIPRATVIMPGLTTFVAMDAPLLKDSDNDAGFYWAAQGASNAWRGADIKRSSDDGVTYASMSSIALRTPIGAVTGTLETGPTEVFDTTTTLTVVMTSGLSTLESISEALVLNGNNAAWVGPATGGVGEVIQFKTATLVASNTYELTGLLRGRLGTEHAVSTHTAGETFVLLQEFSVGSSEYGINDWNKERLFKPVSILTDELLTAAQSFTNTGIRAKPLSPVHVKGTRDGSNNISLSWLRRTRFRVPGLGLGEVPLGEVTERYEVDIFDGATIVRTLEVTSEAASYTAAEQTTDGLTPGDPVTIDVYQLSESRGRGYAARAVV